MNQTPDQNIIKERNKTMSDNMKLFKNGCISEENTCINRCNGYCIMLNESCPAIVRYNDANENNVPCDLSGYKPENI